MAKNTSAVFQIKGTIDGVTFVQSNRYGPHMRAKRGSKKPAPCNEVLNKNASRTRFLNSVATPVYNLLKLYCGNFKHPTLWSKMLSRLRGTASDELFTLLQQLKGIDPHEKYAFDALFRLQLLEINAVGKTFDVFMEPAGHPHFDDISDADGYRYQMIVLFLPQGKKVWRDDAVYTEWLSMDDEAAAFDFSFEKPKGKGIYLLCLRIEAAQRKCPLDTMPGTRMKVVEVGRY